MKWCPKARTCACGAHTDSMPAASECVICHGDIGGRKSLKLECSVCAYQCYHHDCLHDEYFRLVSMIVPKGPKRKDVLNRIKVNVFDGLTCVRSKREGCTGRIMSREWLEFRKAKKPKRQASVAPEAPAARAAAVPPSTPPPARVAKPLILVKAMANIMKQQDAPSPTTSYTLFGESDSWYNRKKPHCMGGSFFAHPHFWETAAVGGR